MLRTISQYTLTRGAWHKREVFDYIEKEKKHLYDSW